jgi:hypothetical protein
MEVIAAFIIDPSFQKQDFQRLRHTPRPEALFPVSHHPHPLRHELFARVKESWYHQHELSTTSMPSSRRGSSLRISTGATCTRPATPGPRSGGEPPPSCATPSISISSP